MLQHKYLKASVMFSYLKVMTALLMGQPMTKEVVGSNVTSDTSAMHVDNQTSLRGTWKLSQIIYFERTKCCVFKFQENWRWMIWLSWFVDGDQILGSDWLSSFCGEIATNILHN